MNTPTGPPPERQQARRRLVLFKRPDDVQTIAVADALRYETVGGVIMLLAAVVAVIWANIGGSYEAVRQFHIGPLSLQHWAADGLLAIFFFCAGLELKRELTVGSLSKPSQALLPIVAAVCGMAVPALIYVAVNVGAPQGHPEGWAIPMATDIAFAMAILAVAAPGLPSPLRAFLLTLAIVDDLGGILVIAILFATGLDFVMLAAAAVCVFVFWLLQRKRVRGWYLYLPLGVACWVFMLNSGVHATIAGVALGLMARSTAEEATDPVDDWHARWSPLSAGIAVPIFALMSAGVAVSVPLLGQLVTDPIGIGIIAALVLGKTLGVFLGTWIAAKLTGARLGGGVRWREVFSISTLAGVGFTVALLIAELSFTDPAMIERAKTAILAGSVLAAVLAVILLRSNTSSRRRLESG